MFLKLLEAVLKTGNRMNVGTNRGDARAFELDTLLKLVDVKGKDGRMTLLHFVVQEISRIEGTELSKDNDRNHQSSLGLQVVSGLSADLTNVKKAATMGSCMLSNEVAKLADGLIKGVLRMCCDKRNDDRDPKLKESMRKFILEAGEEIVSVQAEENATLSLVREATEYFHGDSWKEEAHPCRIFLIVKDFLAILDGCARNWDGSTSGVYSARPYSFLPRLALLCSHYVRDSANGEKSPSDDYLYVIESVYCDLGFRIIKPNEHLS